MKRVAIVTGGSQGLGLALARCLTAGGYTVVTAARRADRLAAASGDDIVGIAGDVTDERHRRDLVDAAARLGPVSLLVNNASTLGASPLPPLSTIPVDVLRRVFDTNVVAPLA